MGGLVGLELFTEGGERDEGPVEGLSALIAPQRRKRGREMVRLGVVGDAQGDGAVEQRVARPEEVAPDQAFPIQAFKSGGEEREIERAEDGEADLEAAPILDAVGVKEAAGSQPGGAQEVKHQRLDLGRVGERGRAHLAEEEIVLGVEG